MLIIAQKAANVNRGNKIFFTKFCGDFAALCARQIWYNKRVSNTLLKWKEKYILFNVIIFFAGAALMLVMAVRASRARLALVNKGVKVQAVVAGTIQNRDGVSLALAFTTPSGDTRRLPYPVPRKAKGLRQGSQVTLYYDPDHPEKVYVEGDKAVLGAEMIYYVLAGLLLALGLVLLVML